MYQAGAVIFSISVALEICNSQQIDSGKMSRFEHLQRFLPSSAISSLLISCRTSRGPRHSPCVQAHSGCILTAESNQTFTEKGKTFVLMPNWHHISLMQNTTPTPSIITYLCRSSALKYWELEFFSLLWNYLSNVVIFTLFEYLLLIFIFTQLISGLFPALFKTLD